MVTTTQGRNAGLWTFKKVIFFLLVTVLQGFQIFVFHSVEITFLNRFLISLRIVIPLVSQILGSNLEPSLTLKFIHVSVTEESHHREVLYTAAAVTNLCATDAAIILKTDLLPNFGLFWNHWFHLLKSGICTLGTVA